MKPDRNEEEPHTEKHKKDIRQKQICKKRKTRYENILQGRRTTKIRRKEERD